MDDIVVYQANTLLEDLQETFAVGVRGRKQKFFITYETHTQDLCYGDANNGQK